MRAGQLEVAGHKVDKKVILLERSPHSKNVQDLSEVSFEKISRFSIGQKGQYHIVTASNPKKTAIDIIQKKLSVVPIQFQKLYFIVSALLLDTGHRKCAQII